MTHIEAIETARDFLCKNRHEILDCDLRVSRTDCRAAGVHFAAWDIERDCIAFVIVTRTKSRLAGAPLALLHDRARVRRAIRNWLRVNRWQGGWRVDAVCICGDGAEPAIDRVMGIRI